MHGPRAAAAPRDDAYVDLPSVPITVDREYSFTWPGRRTDRFLDAAMARSPARRRGARAGRLLGCLRRAPLRSATRAAGGPHDAQPRGRRHPGDRAFSGSRAAGAERLAAPGAAGGRIESRPPGRDGWSYLRRFALRSDAVTAPSAPLRGAARGARCRAAGRRGIPRISSSAPHRSSTWSGTASTTTCSRPCSQRREPRAARAPAIRVDRADEPREAPAAVPRGRGRIGRRRRRRGDRRRRSAACRAPAASRRRGPARSVVFAGRMPYAETLRRIQAADAVVQTSIGFETQGMTVFEAASLGTPPSSATPTSRPSWARAAGRSPTDRWPRSRARCVRPPPTSRRARRRFPTRRCASGSASRRARRRWSRCTSASPPDRRVRHGGSRGSADFVRWGADSASQRRIAPQTREQPGQARRDQSVGVRR